MAQKVDSSGIGAFAVTPSDSLELALPRGTTCTRGVYISGSGDLSVTMNDGTNVTFTAIAGGVIHPLSVKSIKATGTTATGIIAVY